MVARKSENTSFRTNDLKKNPSSSEMKTKQINKQKKS